jgi:threonine dehydrogenase-like Zn-dependent dehydrogenase
MHAVWLEGGVVGVIQQPVPRRPRGSALIRLLCGGICNTDLELQRGYYRYRGIPGHEFVGEVVQADTPRLVGKRVVGEINLGCGRCDWCKQGLGRHCPNRTVLGIVRQPGVFQEYFTLPEQNLHVLPGSIPNEEAVFAEPLAAACEILDQVRIPGGSPVAVLGDGKLGILVAQVLRVHGAEVHLHGRHAHKLKIAAAMGVTTRRCAKRMPLAAYERVVEATGTVEGLNVALAMVKPRGTVVMKSTVQGTVPFDTSALIVNEITVVGSRCGRFAPALRLLRDGRVRVREMISARLPLREAPQAFTLAGTSGILKVLLTP